MLTKGGKHLDTCELKRVTWTADAYFLSVINNVFVV